MASVGKVSGTTARFVSTPSSSGHRPVMSAATEASVNGAAAYAVEKRSAPAASRSRFGVRPSRLPYEPSRSARRVSTVTMSRCRGAGGRAHPAPVARATRASKATRPRHAPDVLVGAHAVRSDRMRIVGG